jgi:hypothetical protein
MFYKLKISLLSLKVSSSRVVECLEDEALLPHPSERLPHGQVASLDERRADLKAKLCALVGSKHHVARDGLEPQQF